MFNNAMYPTIADIGALTNANRNGGFGYDGIWPLVLLIAIFGGFNRGGLWGNGGNGCCCNPCGSGFSNEIQNGFNNQGVMNKLNGLEQGLCSLGYDQLSQMNGINTNIMQTGFGITNAIQQSTITDMQNTNALSRQLDACCCDNRAAIAQVRYDMATDTCAVTTAIANAARDITENANANYRALHDEFVQFQRDADKAKIAEQQSMIQALNLAQSQANQNQYLLNALRPCPVPSYNVPNPWACYGVNGYQGDCAGRYC